MMRTIVMMSSLLSMMTLFAVGGGTPTTGLYFVIGNSILLSNESVNITDIGEQPFNDRTDPGSTLVCVTDNVNRNCCRGGDTGYGSIGGWYHDNQPVLSLNAVWWLTNTFVRIVHARQVRLAAIGRPTGPVGDYTCSVPYANGTAATATVSIINVVAVTSVSITPTSPSATAGSSLALTCLVNTVGRGNLTLSWTGHTPRGAITTQVNVPGMFTDTLQIDRASQQICPSVRCEARIGDSIMSATITLTVIVPTATSVIITNGSPTIGQMLNLTCIFFSSLDPTRVSYVWRKDRQVVTGQITNELIINPIQRTDNNTAYTCESVLTSPYLSGTIGDTSEIYQLIILVIVSNVEISPANPTRQAGLMGITFFCTATLSSPGLPTFTWSGPSMLSHGPTTPPGPAASTFTNTLTIQRVRQSDAGTYQCRVSIGQSTRTDSTMLHVTVNSPSSPIVMAFPRATSVLLTWSQSSMDVVDSYTISYMRTAGCPDAPSGSRTSISGSVRSYDLTGLEEDITYDITITAINTANQMSTTTSVTTVTAVPNGIVHQILQGETNLTSISLSWQPLSCLQQNGPIIQYNILYRESSNVVGPLSTNSTSFTASSLYPGVSYTFEIAAVNSHNGQSVGPYTSMVISAMQPTDVLFLQGMLYSNNSLLNMEEIGVDSNALFCLTNITQCCTSGGRDIIRDWYYPNNNRIGIKASNTISRTRGSQSVILHRDNTLQPVGIFRCQINNDNVYVGIYPENSGSPEIQSLSYNTSSGVLTCISTGGPATDVTWNRRGQVHNQNKNVVDTVNGIYHNLLTITSSQISDYTGSFNCTVRNTRGSRSRTTGEYKAIGLSGNHSSYFTGSSASVICFSNFTVLSIRWINMSSDAPFTTVPLGQNEVRLTVDVAISRELHGSTFSCETVIKLPSEYIATREVFTIMTKEEPSGPVVSFLVDPQGDTEIQITWRPPDMPGGMITGYLLKIRDLKDNDFKEDIQVSQASFIRQNLESGVPYEVSVAAVNTRGPGQITSQIVFTKELKPNVAPELTVERTSVTVMIASWNLLTLVEARGFVRNYTILYSPVLRRSRRQQTRAMSETVNGHTSNIIIGGLKESLGYSVQISANTGAGTGTMSHAVILLVFDSQSNFGITIGAAVMSVSAVVIFFTTIVMSISIWMVMHRRKARNSTVTQGNSRDESHEYESVERRIQTGHGDKKKTEDIDMSSCVAYGEIPATNKKDVSNSIAVYETVQ